MSQNLTTYPIGQMPQVTSPDLLYIKIMRQLAAYTFDRATESFAFTKLIRRKLCRLAIFRWHRKLKSLLFKKLPMKRLRQVSSITQQYAYITFGQFSKHTNVVNICGGQIECLNHTQRVDFDVQAKSIKGLISKLFAVSCNAFEELAEPRSGKSTDMDREAIYNGNDISKSLCYVFDESFLNLPEICRVAGETNSTGELREVVSVEVPKESEDVFVGVETKNFADDFHGKYFAISHLWHGSSASQLSFWLEFFHKIISFTEDIYDKIIKIHCLALHDQWNNFCFLPVYSIGQRAFLISTLS